MIVIVFAGAAVAIAVLGLVGLAAHAAVSRTREIGIRKTFGGGRWAIARLLLRQFSRPVFVHTWRMAGTQPMAALRYE